LLFVYLDRRLSPPTIFLLLKHSALLLVFIGTCSPSISTFNPDQPWP
jgi:hypothetical protein